MIGTVCVARVAMAEPLAPAAFEGRWLSEKGLMLDISRCGENWCGVVVADNACGRTALRVGENPANKDAAMPDGSRRELHGQLQLAANTESYGVRVDLSRDKAGALSLFIAGHSGGLFSAIRRTFDYRDQFVRNGESSCRPDPKVS